MAGEFDEAGETVPNFTLYDLDGQAVSLYDYAEAGELMVVSLCAMWCGPCRSLASDYDAIAAAYGDDFTFIELVLEDQFFQTADAADASFWASVYGLGGVEVLSVGGDSALADAISAGASLIAFPTYLVIDPASQTLVGSFTGYDGAEAFTGRIEALAETVATPIFVEGANGDGDITGGAAGDDLSGGRGDDTISGGDGDDMISGGRGGDDLSGGEGDDTISGGQGADILRGDAGDDLLTGGRGADLFVFDLASGADVITDFHAGSDEILFDDLGFADYEAVGAQDGADAVVLIQGVGAFDGVEFARITAENADIADVLGFFS